MNWLDLARAGENCPQATERSFSAHERAKWERAAEYTNRSGGTAPGCEPGDLPDYPGVTAGKDEHDRAREREEAEWGFPMPLADDAPIDWKIALRARDERIAALAIERGYLRRALERIAADLGLDEESFPVPTDAGEIVSFRQVIRGRIADLAQKRGEAQDGYKHFTFDPPVRIGEAKEMPPWPAPIVTSDDYYYAKEVEAWRDAALARIAALEAKIAALEAENARLLGMGIDQATRLETLAQDPKEGERSAMREVRPETSASSEPLGSALSDDEIGSRIMNGLGGEKYDPSDLMPWERRVGKRARALFAKPAPVAVTRERIERAVERGVATSIQSAAHRSVNEHVAEAIMDALSAPVSAEALERACKQAYLSRPFARSWEHDANRMARMGEARALLKQLGIATEGT